MDADRGQCGGKTQHLGLRQADLLTSTGNAHGHRHNGLLGGSKVVAQLSDRGVDISEQ